MRTFCLIVVIICLPLSLSWAQETQQLPEDIDALFQDDTPPKDTKEPGDETAENSDLLTQVVMQDNFSLGADFLLVGGYSPGLNYLPYDVSDPSEIKYQDKFIAKLNSSVSLNVRFSPEFRVFNKISARLPELELEVTELFCDYTVADTVFLRLGRQTITWGISRNYPFTNLLARLPADATDNNESADSFAFKMNIPIGTGGLEAVAFTRSSFWIPSDEPAADEIGYGGKLNLAFEFADINIGGFYHKDMDVRFFYTVKTTLFDSLEVYTEGLLAMEQAWFIDPETRRIGFSANAGIYFDLFSRMLEINAEYFYNGEESDPDQLVKGDLFPMFPGHNAALNVSFALFDRKFKLLFQGKYNITENSGVIIPAATLSLFPHLTFTLAVPWILGPTDGEYSENNEENDNRRISLILGIVLKGSL
ncbi:MAG: hypothetical protein JW904_00880 [Spirochaetales bacterium]|nr:hypothetical protein [Spirochaetales bacterium]